MSEAAREIADIAERLDDSSLAVLLEVARRFDFDFGDIATEDDIENHKKAMEEYARGECIHLKREDWGLESAAAV